MEDAVMADPVEFLATRRSRRSTAGNRMEAALAEMALDTNAEANEEDIEFENANDEQDEVGSDFESTDEETAQDEPDEAEKAIYDDERRARKAARSKLEKATATAHAKHQATFNPQKHAPSTPAEDKIHRKVSLGPTINAETGDAIHPQSSPRKKRYSQRTSTVASTSATVARAKRSEEQKALAPKKAKYIVKTYTQAELIARALDNEEGNIVEHRDYLKNEEEKRNRARVVRSTIEGPLVRWISKAEEEKTTITPPPPPPAPPQPTPTPYSEYSSPYAYYYGYNPPGSTAVAMYPYPYSPAGPLSGTPAYTMRTPAAQNVPAVTPQAEAVASAATQASTSTTPGNRTTSPIHPSDSIQDSSTPAAPPTSSSGNVIQTPGSKGKPPPSSNTPAPYLMLSFSSKQDGSTSGTAATATVPTSQTSSSPPYLTYYNPYAQTISTAGWPPATPAAQPTQPPTPQEPIERVETVTKNYLVHEAGQYDGVPKPPWKDTMTAVFGDHVKWDEVKVYATSKARPTSRPTQVCPITGKVAKYFDPRSGVPFADVEAFRTLSEVLKHEYIWDPALKRYVGHEPPPS